MITNNERVRERAYHYWQAAGEPEGQDLECWLKAEAEMENQPGAGLDQLEAIRVHAYFLWLNAGCPEGQAEEYWRRAEQASPEPHATAASPEARP